MHNNEHSCKKAFANPQFYRDLILSHCKVSANKDYNGKSFVCVSLTRFCPVGCNFCFFKSAPVYKKPTREDQFTNEDIDNFIYFANNINLGYLLVSGGGEPMLQRKALIKLIKEVDSERIVLVTSANWAQSMHQAEAYIAEIASALEKRRTTTWLTVRISCDLEHNKDIGLGPVLNLIELFIIKYKNYKNFDLQLHSLFDDPSINGLIEILNNKYQVFRSPINDERISDGQTVVKIVPKQEIISVDSYPIRVGYSKVFYSDLKVDLGSDISKSLHVYQTDLLLSEDGNSSIVENINGNYGLDFWVNYNGNVTTWGNQLPDNLFNVHIDTPEDVITQSLRDPASLSFIEKGAIYRDRIISEVNPIAVTRAKAVNIRDYTGALLFDEARTRLYYSLRALQGYVAEGRIIKEQLNLWPESIRALIACDAQQLKDAYHAAGYTIVEQVISSAFNANYIKDYLELIKLGHYQLSSEKIQKLLNYYNDNVAPANQIYSVKDAQNQDLHQITRMTEYLTSIKPQAKQTLKHVALWKENVI